MTPLTVSITAAPDPELDTPMRWRVTREDGYVHIELVEVRRVVLSVMTSEAGAQQLLEALAGEALPS